MTTVDIRAVCSCSLGELVSASISDDFLDGSGLVRSKGVCVLKGTSVPAFGTQVSFSYVGPGGSGTIPRRLYVIGGAASPFTNTTSVTLGCLLTLNQDFREDIKIDATGDVVIQNN